MTAVFITARSGHRLFTDLVDRFGPVHECDCGLFTLTAGTRFANTIAPSKVSSTVTAHPALEQGEVLTRWRAHVDASPRAEAPGPAWLAEKEMATP